MVEKSCHDTCEDVNFIFTVKSDFRYQYIHVTM